VWKIESSFQKSGSASHLAIALIAHLASVHLLLREFAFEMTLSIFVAERISSFGQ